MGMIYPRSVEFLVKSYVIELIVPSVFMAKGVSKTAK